MPASTRSLVRHSRLTVGLCVLGLMLVTHASDLLAADCYKELGCQAFYLPKPGTVPPTGTNPPFCRVETKAALKDEKSLTNIDAFQRGSDPMDSSVKQCGVKQTYNPKTGKHEDDKDLLGNFTYCGQYLKGKECAGL